MDKETISATEINKFVYCPKQWYYIRIHGEKALREMYREMFPERAHKTNESFVKGNAFHENFMRREKARILKRRLLIFAALVILFGGLLILFAL
ncbi:MAG: hypothetical protein FWC95_00200 [Defluviitaleaceae bacterium]|nr:hypothetical protein [Defluviitaleaceae bacterium]